MPLFKKPQKIFSLNFAELIQIIKGLFTASGKTWVFISEKNYPWRDVLIYFTIPMFFLSSYAGIFNVSPELEHFNLPPNWMFLVIFTGTVLAIFLSSWMITAMTPRFNGEKSFDKVFSLISFSYTPVLFASLISSLHTVLQFMNFVGLVYMVFLLWRGTGLVLGIPAHKQTGYSLISLLILFASRVVISAFLASLALVLTGNAQDILNQN